VINRSGAFLARELPTDYSDFGSLNRKFHVATKRSGTKQIQSGAKPVIRDGHVPRISRLLALAHHCFQLLRTGAIINQSELAHFGQIPTTRMTQIITRQPRPRHPRRNSLSGQNDHRSRRNQRGRPPPHRQNARLEQATANVEVTVSKGYWLAGRRNRVVDFGSSWQPNAFRGAGK
jgi:hypothetical protein